MKQKVDKFIVFKSYFGIPLVYLITLFGTSNYNTLSCLKICELNNVKNNDYVHYLFYLEENTYCKS